MTYHWLLTSKGKAICLTKRPLPFRLASPWALAASAHCSGSRVRALTRSPTPPHPPSPCRSKPRPCPTPGLARSRLRPTPRTRGCVPSRSCRGPCEPTAARECSPSVSRPGSMAPTRTAQRLFGMIAELGCRYQENEMDTRKRSEQAGDAQAEEQPSLKSM